MLARVLSAVALLLSAICLAAQNLTAIQQDVISVAAVGDIMLGSSWPDASGLPPDDGAWLLKEVTPILQSADITFGNLEGPLLDGGVTSKCPPRSANCFAFRVPTRYGKYLKEAGFDVMSLANNHALDFGHEGRNSTKRVLDQLGIAHSGEVGDIARLTVKGKKVALIAFSTYDHSYNLNRLGEASRIVAELASGSDLVIVSFHGGAEGARRQHVPFGPEWFFGENRGDLRRFARAMIDAGADLLLGHGPHVVRGMEVYRERLIAYSLGNFATYGKFSLKGPLGLSLILEVKLSPEGKFLGGRIYSIKQEEPGGPRLDPAGKIIPILRRLSSEDFGSNAVIVNDEGNLSPPPMPK
jgi:poly-gamma-glutamate capsule biosynthesis protein CapA/YwtB (metallophosphatase superfamily)